MKAGLALATLAVVRLVGSFAMSAIPANSYRGDHAQAGVTEGKWQESDKASTGWNCPRGGGKRAGWDMKGGKICSNLPDGGSSASGGVTK